MRRISWILATGLLAAMPAASAELGTAVDRAGMDTTVKPGDDFNAYANGTWTQTAEIPADSGTWGVGAMLREKTLRDDHQLLIDAAANKAPKTEDERKVGAFYTSFMDEAGIEKKGATPLAAGLKKIAALKDKTAFARAAGAALRADVDALNNTNFYTENLFGLWVAPDFADPTHYTPYLMQGGLGLPDREYYLADSAKMTAVRDAYKAHIANSLTLAGIPDAIAKADAIFALETKIAKVHASRADNADVLKGNNPWSRADFAAKAPGFAWDAFLDGAQLGKRDHFIVWQPSAFAGIAAVVNEAPLDTLKAYMAFHYINHYAPVLSKSFVDEGFAMYGTALSGVPQQPARWKRAVNASNLVLGDAVGQLYAARYFPADTKVKVQEMVANIKTAFAARIDALDWMSAATKAKAKEKLETLYVGVGYPEKWRDYSTLAIAEDDLAGNYMRWEAFDYRSKLAKLDRPVDNTEWSMTPQTVNAVNLPLQNALNFPAAYLQPPNYDPNAGDAHNYGAIGSTIGHEISHSFDDQGSQFDAHGKLTDWWTKEDYAHFKQSSEDLAKQYDGYCPFSDLCVNGHQTLSENIADVAGLSAAFDAWRASLGGKPSPVVDGFAGEQVFFLSNGQKWRYKARENSLRQQLLTDSHSPAMVRAQGVRNLDGWYAAFNVKPGDKLYLAPDKRVKVW